MESKSRSSLAPAICAMVLIVSGCTQRSDEPEKIRIEDVGSRVVKLFGGPESVHNVVSPTKVEAFRVDGDPKTRDEKAPFAGYPILSGPVEVDAETSEQLAAIILDEKAYLWDMHKACEIIPGVAVRFTKDGKSTEILICFSCDQLAMIHNGKWIGTHDCDPARGPLLAIAKRLFPNDKEIQDLKTDE